MPFSHDACAQAAGQASYARSSVPEDAPMGEYGSHRTRVAVLSVF